MKLGIGIVLKAAVSGIRHHHFRIVSELISVSFQKGDCGLCIIDIRTDVGIGNIPVIHSDLDIVSWFKHVRVIVIVIFHMHHCRIRIGLGETVSLSQYIFR